MCGFSFLFRFQYHYSSFYTTMQTCAAMQLSVIYKINTTACEHVHSQNVLFLVLKYKVETG